MAYVQLSDLRDGLGQTPEQMEQTAAGMEANAKNLRAAAVSNNPAAPALAAQANALEISARQLRQAAGTKRSMSEADSPMPLSKPAPSRSVTMSWPMAAGVVVGVLGLAGLAGAVVMHRSMQKA